MLVSVGMATHAAAAVGFDPTGAGQPHRGGRLSAWRAAGVDIRAEAIRARGGMCAQAWPARRSGFLGRKELARFGGGLGG